MSTFEHRNGLQQNLTLEDRDYLYQIFPDGDHEVREGITSKGGKVRWFVYLKRESIINFLDARYFGEWDLTYHSARDHATYSEVYARITLRGCTRENNGSNAGNSGEHIGKAAATNAFKRVASQFGIGLYLKNAPQIWTEYDYVENGRTDYQKREKRKGEALKQVYAWLASLHKEDDWLKQVMDLTRSFYVQNEVYNPQHHTNSIQKAVEDGRITREMSAIKSASIMLMYRAEKDYKLAVEDVQFFLQQSLSDWLKNGHSLADAWGTIIEAASLVKGEANGSNG